VNQEVEAIIYTIGHSTRTQEELIALLRFYSVQTLIDIRRVPYSRHNAQFNREEMITVIPRAGIRYEHLTQLGGVKPSQEVIDRAKSCSERSRGFAAYMQSPPFLEGIERVLTLAKDGTLALMCAESDPRHCHRFWVADALVGSEGISVKHIISIKEAWDHPANLFTYE
jgi:uncharacterized protein (DUF488 family)